MSQVVSWAVVVGLALGFGCWLIASTVPRLSRPGLAARIAPYLVDVSPNARELTERRTADPLPVFGLMLEPVSRWVRSTVALVAGGDSVIRTRLRQAGRDVSVERFRSSQVGWATVAAAAAILVSIVGSRLRPIPVVAQIAFVLLVAVAGFLGRDWLLQRRARARLTRMTKELPTVLEFLTLSLSAGEAILDALRRVSRVSRGELAAELAGVVTTVGAGLPLADSLVALSRQLQLAPLTRAIDQLTGALERGSPLVEVLRAQAQDARDEAKRDLLELAGKKEVAMLIPLVFLILPVTILFAIYPGVFVLQVGF